MDVVPVTLLGKHFVGGLLPFGGKQEQKIAVRSGIVRLEFQRMPVILLCFVHYTQIHLRIGQVAIGFC